MNPRATANGFRERFQWGSYGFIPGLLLGIVLGWIFSGVVSWLFRFGLALLILIPLVLLFFAWRWFTTRDDQREVVVYEYADRRPGEQIETGGRIVDTNGGTAER